MATFLVTWNASADSWGEYESDLLTSSDGRIVESPWSFQYRKDSPEGAKVFMLRQVNQRGILASGVIVSDIYEDDHWNPLANSDTATYVDIEWDVILPVEDRLRTEDLIAGVPGHHWNYVLNSGQRLKAPADAVLEERWREHIARLGVEPSVAYDDEWAIEPGAIATRSEVATRYGGATQGDIQPSSSTPNVMIYSDPTVGHAHGYDYDGPADGAYYYTGEGQVGDQVMQAGNKAIADHEDAGRVLRLFEAAGSNRSGGKPQRYLGAYGVDPAAPYRFESARDRNGDERRVIVFRLLPAGAAIGTAHPVVASAPHTETRVEIVPTEDNTRRSFDVAEIDPREGVRWEASLMRQLEQHLSSNGHEVMRLAIKPARETARLVTDTYDVTESELFEIKPSASRAHVRMAVAQLLDYRRHLPTLRAATVLLPVAPSDDLRHLVESIGLGLAIFHDNELVRLTSNQP